MKGLLMCLVKALGLSHQDLKRLLKKAKRQKPAANNSTSEQENKTNSGNFKW